MSGFGKLGPRREDHLLARSIGTLLARSIGTLLARSIGTLLARSIGKRAAAIAALFSLLVLTGCTSPGPDGGTKVLPEPEPDVQPEPEVEPDVQPVLLDLAALIRKSDLEGSWRVGQTVVATDEAGLAYTFVGEGASDPLVAPSGSAHLRVRWTFEEENKLVGIRDYSIDGVDYSTPVVEIPVLAHLDGEDTTLPDAGAVVVVPRVPHDDWRARPFARIDFARALVSASFASRASLPEHFAPSTRETVAATALPGAPVEDSLRLHIEADAPKRISFILTERLAPVAGETPAGTSWLRTTFTQVAPPGLRHYLPGTARDGAFAHRALASQTADAALSSWRVPSPRIVRQNPFATWFEQEADGSVSLDQQGRPMPLMAADRTVRPLEWQTTTRFPDRLLRPAFEAAAAWNVALVESLRAARGQPLPSYPHQACQSVDPDRPCFCLTKEGDAADAGPVALVESCRGQYDAFLSSDDALAAGVADPIRCSLGLAGGSALVADNGNFSQWRDVEWLGDECLYRVLPGACHAGNIDQHATLDCPQPGIPETFVLDAASAGPFLAVASLLGDPVSGELFGGALVVAESALTSQQELAETWHRLLTSGFDEDEGLVVDRWSELHRQVILSAVRPGAVADPTLVDVLAGYRQRAASRLNDLAGEEGAALSLRTTRLTDPTLRSVETSLMNGVEGRVRASMEDMAAPYSAGDAPIDSAARVDEGRSLKKAADQWRREAYALFDPVLLTWAVDGTFRASAGSMTSQELGLRIQRRVARAAMMRAFGRALGLQTNPAASTDRAQGWMGAYDLDLALPMPDPASFDAAMDGLDRAEQLALQRAADAVMRSRIQVGLNWRLSSSVLDLDSNPALPRTRVGRADRSALAASFWERAELYDNSATQAGTPRPALALNEINALNTRRARVTTYAGGEACAVDEDCPYAAAGARAAHLTSTNLDLSLTQTCEAGVCSSLADDAAPLLDVAAGGWFPVVYANCSLADLGRFGVPRCQAYDAGASAREVVALAGHRYEITLPLRTGRLGRDRFSFGHSLAALRRLFGGPLGLALGSSAAEIADNDPTVPFSPTDQTLAGADLINLLSRLASAPQPGGYFIDSLGAHSVPAATDLEVSLGLARPGASQLDNDGLGSIGSIHDAIFAVQLLTTRGYGAPGSHINLADVFPIEAARVLERTVGATDKERTLLSVVCDPAGAPACPIDLLVYGDAFIGDCAAPLGGAVDAERCLVRPPVAGPTFLRIDADLGRWTSLIGFVDQATVDDRTFDARFFVCSEGAASCPAPGPLAVELFDYVRFTDFANQRTFIAWPALGAGGSSAAASWGPAFVSVRSAEEVAFINAMLRKYRGDFLPGNPPPNVANLTLEEQSRLAVLGYPLPDSTEGIEAAIQLLAERRGRLASLLGTLSDLAASLDSASALTGQGGQ